MSDSALPAADRPEKASAHRPALRVQGLVVAYSNGVNAVRGIDLEIAAGASTAVIGPSGSGKSSLLNAVAGLAPLTAGTVEVGGERVDLHDEAQRRRFRRSSIGIVFQDGQLFPELDATENVALPLRLTGSGKRDALRAAHTCLTELGLVAEVGRPLRELSGGQLQRVAVARAVVHSPMLVLADEPTGALDSVNRDLVLSLLVDATVRRGRTLVMVTHDLDVASRCDRIVRLRDGMIDER